ncbi:MAG: SAM-dependent methyltransferase, partial [Chloroflexi bacterium]|nr:SAM-dependent methyltransferase [Chloroflexota bacterium]
MPASCCKPDYDAAFDARTARRQLTAYRRSGASGSTLRLVKAIRDAGARGSTVLDIGGGVGIIGLELLAAGA